MKKFLILSIILFSQEIMSRQPLYIENWTKEPIRLSITRYEITAEKILKPGFARLDENRALSPDNKIINLKTIARLKPSKVDYYAFVVTSKNDNDFEIKQRVNADAKLILEEHKNPKNPMFIQDLPTGKDAVALFIQDRPTGQSAIDLFTKGAKK